MKRLTFKSICEKLASNEIVKVSTTFGYISFASPVLSKPTKKERKYMYLAGASILTIGQVWFSLSRALFRLKQLLNPHKFNNRHKEYHNAYQPL